jgi:hypothetical protein
VVKGPRRVGAMKEEVKAYGGKGPRRVGAMKEEVKVRWEGNQTYYFGIPVGSNP